MHPCRTLLLITALALTAAATPAHSAHPLEGQRLTQNWLFIKGDNPDKPATAPADTAAWTPVTIPHTWNAIDGQGGGEYYRGPGWYKTTVELPASALTNGQRAYLRFEAVSTVADVYFNGHHLGSHRGGFNAFTFEITQFAHAGANELLVRADNSPQPDIAPLSGDFTVFGGIYRPVHLIIKQATSFNLLDHGTSGVDIDQISVTDKSASIRVTATVNTTLATGDDIVVSFGLLDADGRIVEVSGQTNFHANLKQNETRTFTTHLTINNPHLWQGIDDPYLYKLNVCLASFPPIPPNTAGSVFARPIDSQTWLVGLRSITIDPAHGFFLNGKPYKLHGVNRHQDRPGKGWAISDDDHAEDVRLIREMGANAVRLAHYPHSDTFHELCLRAGLLVWAENPLVDTIGKPADPALLETTKTQLLELIRQRRNYSNIFAWSLANELRQKPTDDPAPVVTALNALARKEDPHRKTTLATNKPDNFLCNATDILAFNAYPGWYVKDPGAMAKTLSDYNTAGGNRGVAVSEYGAGASIRQHEQNMTAPPKTTGPWHPEEWQAIVHEKNYPAIAEAGYCWGGFIWNMFDFASAGRHEGDTEGRNDKGLVTYDRQTRKNAFYYYKANWSKDDVLHITSRRHTDRTDAQTEVKVYTNAPGDITLTINGRAIGVAKPDAYHVCRWENVTLTPGQNEVTVTATRDARALRDTCTWTLTAAAGSAEIPLGGRREAPPKPAE